jgi:hypothetical protein
MGTSPDRLPLSLKIAAAYLLLCGTASVIMLACVSLHSGFTAREVGACAREILFCLSYLVSGVGILLSNRWACNLALVILVAESPYSAARFARGFAGGKPNLSVYLFSFILVIAWSGVWFYIICRGRRALRANGDRSE